jgi:lipoate-protein ligase A
MAADELMLEMAAETGVASLRFYAWRPPTLSLGYFQPAALRRSDRRRAGLAWVRRPSGGGAIVHDFELTYCLALPADMAWPSEEPWLQRMHGTIARALGHLGFADVALATQETVAGKLCFQRQTPGDVLCRGTKIVGSAQRKHKRALLQHGSILLEQSRYAPELPGLLELSGERIGLESLQGAIVKEFLEVTGWEVRAETELFFSPTVSKCIWELRYRELVEKYSGWEWNMKR